MGKYLLEQDLVAAHARGGGDVVALGLADQRVDDQPVGDLERAAQQVLVRAVDGVAGLEGHGAPPARVRDELAKLRRIAVVLGEAGARWSAPPG